MRASIDIYISLFYPYLEPYMHLRNLLNRKLLFRITIPTIIATGMFISVIIDSLFTSIPTITYAWVLIGFIIGYPFGRLTKISWNSNKTQLVLDGSGLALIISYIVISIVRSIIIRIEFSDLSYVLAITLLASVGGQIGRTIGMIRQIQMALKSKNHN